MKEPKYLKDPPPKRWIYKNHEIELYGSGWYSCFVLGAGTLKADTLSGIKEMINEHARKSRA